MDKPYRRMRPLLGTFVEIGATSCGSRTESAVHESFRSIEKVQGLLSFHDPESDISVLNHSDGREVALNPLTIKVLKLAFRMEVLSDGLFNCTVGGELVKAGVLPDHGSNAYLAMGTFRDIEIRKETAILKRPIRITLDGIAKGFAVDLAVGTMKKCGIASGWVNAGGDLKIFGETSLPIHQRNESGDINYLGHFSSTAIATSACTKYFQRRSPGRIVCPDSVVQPLGTWTVQSNSAWLSDALTKVASLAPPEMAHQIVGSLGGKILHPMTSLQ